MTGPAMQTLTPMTAKVSGAAISTELAPMAGAASGAGGSIFQGSSITGWMNVAQQVFGWANVAIQSHKQRKQDNFMCEQMAYQRKVTDPGYHLNGTEGVHGYQGEIIASGGSIWGSANAAKAAQTRNGLA